MAGLPPGATWRAMQLSDAGAIQQYLAARSVALIGIHQYSPEGVDDFLRNPQLALTTDTWLISADDKIIGTAAVVQRPDCIGIELTTADRSVADWLFDRAVARAAEATRAAGLSEQLVRIAVLGADKQLAELAAARGFTHETSIQRMRIAHTGPLDRPDPPTGVVVRNGAPDEAARRTAYRLIAESFDDQPSASPPGYDEWVAAREARSTFDWSQLTVLELDGTPVAVREFDRNFISSDNAGYIGRIGVLAPARGLGLAKYLLRDQFAIDATAGLSGTMLHVDSSNPTPALGLYLSVGMRPDIVTDRWRKTLRV
ncbi:GNAT family N-acetyltransferase [Kribbella ginsengisoli]|uniref:N-acetyltransferase domain-containing protein n=1 Tax=Kribbella ginsengisoli TaxID=363865 RepID=A0ABP6W472_9ACTN